jgi:hypothetical protein
MVYDAILNGARSLAFYGGNLDRCWNDSDTAHGWNWTFWNDVLRDLVREIAADSPIAPALVSPESTKALTASDATSQAISREGTSPNDLWVLAARSGEGSQAVTISGLPPAVTSGTVYTEGRSIPVENGSFTDTFDRWDVHVYRFDATPPPPPPPPPGPPASPSPSAVAARAPLSVRGLRLSSVRHARPFRVDLLVAGERGSAKVSCSARIGRKALRAYERGWTASAASCAWRLPRASRGKRVGGVVRVDGLHRRYSVRIR